MTKDNINNNPIVEKLKEDFWEKIRPRTKKEIEEEAMIVKVKKYHEKLKKYCEKLIEDENKNNKLK